MAADRTPGAFAEAMGGAIGAVWSTLLFYPADVAKIRLQAEADAHDEPEHEPEGQGEGASLPLAAAASETATTAQAERRGGGGGGGAPKSFFQEVLVVLKRPDLWYAGLSLKLQLAVVSTFVYFYCYASLKRAYSRLFKRGVTFLPNLALASLAGVVNILVTMPMDTVVTRMQVAPQGQQRPTLAQMVRTIWEEGKGKSPGKGKGDAQEVLFWRLARFWHGLLPALILTSNPAINYAVYDALKAVVPVGPGKKRHGPRETFLIGMLSKFVATLVTYPLIRAKVMMMADTKRLKALAKQQQQQQQQQRDQAEDVEMGGFQDEEAEEEKPPHERRPQQDEEAPGRGAIGCAAAAGGASSSPATSSASAASSSGGSSSSAPPSLRPSGASFASSSSSAGSASGSVLSPSLQLMAEERQGLLEIMRQLVREGGVKELYVGLDGQVINTALKNAVLMNTKDRISRITAFLLRRFLLGSPA